MQSRITESVFKMKYDLYSQELFNIAYGYTRNIQDSEDVIQNVFMKYLNSNKKFPSNQDEKYWLIRVTINDCINFVKSSYKKTFINNDVIQNIPSSDEVASLDDLSELVKSLPVKYKNVILLHYYDCLTVKEIAQIISVSESAVKKRLERARSILRNKMEVNEWM